MPRSPKQLEIEKNIDETSRNVGLTQTITITAYDKGILQIDGTPLQGVSVEDPEAWLEAGIVIAQKLAQLQREAAKRRDEKRADT